MVYKWSGCKVVLRRKVEDFLYIKDRTDEERVRANKKGDPRRGVLWAWFTDLRYVMMNGSR